MTRLRRPRAGLVLLALFALAVPLAAATSADGATARTVTLTPATDVGPGEFVRVGWSGFAPGQTVFFRECKASPARVSSDCTALYSDTGYTDSTGTGALYEQVTVGDVRSEAGTIFRCDAKTPCSIGVFRGGALSSATFAPVRLAPQQDACPASKGAAIAGGGADQAALALYNWGLQACVAPHLLNVNYIPANSQDGRANFINGLNDFAVTGAPFTSDEQAQLASKHRTFAYAPVSTSALVLAYKVFDQGDAGAAAQVTDLKLTPEIVARIFTGQLTNWQADPAVNALNPGHRFPPAVRPLVRGDHSDANRVFTTWLTQTAPGSLPASWPGPSDNYPPGYLTQNAAIVGGDKLALALANPATVDNSTEYFNIDYIGFVDATQAAYDGLPTAKIENAAGAFVAATPASISAALAHATPNADGTTVQPDFATTDAAAYPMPLVDYAVVPTGTTGSAKDRTLKAFLDYAIGEGQKHLPAGAAPLPTALAAKATAAIAEIPTTLPTPKPKPKPKPKPGAKPPVTQPVDSNSGTTSSSTPGSYSTGSSGTGSTTPAAGTTGTSAAPVPTASAAAAHKSAAKPSSVVAVFQKQAGRLLLPAIALLGLAALLLGLGLVYGERIVARTPLPRWIVRSPSSDGAQA